MVAIFTGAGAGFERGSGSLLGSTGLLGSANLGRGGDQLFLNAATGNLLIQRQDEFLSGRGLDVSAIQTYNSLGDLSDDNADNWRLSTDRRVYGLTGTVNTAGSTVHCVSGDGSDILYTWDSTQSTYLATDGAGSFDKLTYDGVKWTRTDGDSQVTETYTASGSQWLISKQADPDGNALTFSYANGHIYRVTDANGEYVQYDWSGNNVTDLVTGYTDLATSVATTLTRTRYTYDAQNRLQSVTVDLSPNDSSIADGKVYVTTYSYVGTSKLVSSISQSDGSKIDLSYDTSSRVASIVQTVATGVSQTSTLTYGAGYTTITDPMGQVTRLDYDSSSNLAKITLPAASTGVPAQVTQFTYDTSGNVTSVTDALGNTTNYLNFVNGLATTITDRAGNVTTRTYGSKNELLTETTSGSDANSSSAQHTVRYAYDAENHVRYKISAEGRVTEYQYTTAGLLTSTTDYPEQSYDTSALALNQAPTEADLNAWRAAITDKSSTKVMVEGYDVRGNLVQDRRYSIANADGTVSTAEGFTYDYYTYDQTGRLLTHNRLNQNTESYIYDGLGRLVSAVDVNGGTTSYVFDDANTKTIVKLSTGLIQTSTYNKCGELISYTETPGYGELVTNGDGSSATGWSGWYGNVSSVGGHLRVTADNTGGTGTGYQVISTVPGQTYYVSWTGYAGTAYAQLVIGSNLGQSDLYNGGQVLSGSDTRTASFVATGTTAYVQLGVGSFTTGYADFDNISVMTDARSTAGYSELITNGYGSTTAGWTTATHSAVTAIGNRLRVSATDGGGVPIVYQGITTIPGETYRIALDAYAGTAQPRVGITSNRGGIDLGSPWLISTGNISGHFEATFTADATTTYIGLTTNDFTAGTYAEFDNISVFEQPAGTATYGYDQLGRLRWEIDASNKKTYHLYDNAGRKTADVSGTGEKLPTPS